MLDTILRITIISLLIGHYSYGQERTVGTILISDDDVQNGYTLISPITYNKTYLINNCGEVINEWTSEYTAGLMAYLLEDGRLLRGGMSTVEFGAGGAGGIIELFSWDGELLWSYKYSDDRVQHHHDIEYLPNGNILVLAWVKLNEIEIIDTGRDPEFIDTDRGLWTESIVELKPKGLHSAEIVWEWNAFDHLIQDRDSLSGNYGIVQDHPELIDANYPYRSISTGDWMHFNSVDYNETLDQIILGSRNFNEFYIIDHSTTTEEAASHSGGRYGKGGDILYRWGNPEVYKRGTADDVKLFGLHDPHFVEVDNDDNSKIIVFNNGAGRLPFYSAIEIIVTDHDNGFYNIDSIAPYGPEEPNTVIESNDEIDFNSPRISGVQQLPNGNLLICSGNKYQLIELTPDGELAWLYENPVASFGPIPQGASSAARDLFRAHKYNVEYPAFIGRDLTPGDFLELQPMDDACGILSAFDDITDDFGETILYPNPSLDWVYINSDKRLDFKLLNSTGQYQYSGSISKSRINVSSLNPGIYILQLFNDNHKYTAKIIKQ